MSDSGQPPPQRIGDAERDRAAEFLREHLAQGRLDPAEFDDRLNAALRARVQPELDRLFVDLPSPTPHSPGSSVTPAAQPSQPVPDPNEGLLSPRTHHTMDILVGLLWPITLAVLFFVTGWNQWWLIFVPIVASSIWGRRKQQDNDERAQRRKELRQRDDEQ